MGNLQESSLINLTASPMLTSHSTQSHLASYSKTKILAPTKPTSQNLPFKIEPIPITEDFQPLPQDSDSQQGKPQKTIEQVRVKWSSFIKMREGDYLHQYEVLKQLGRGGYGSVYKVRSRYSNIIRAAKKIKKADLTAKQQQRLFNEVAILQSLDHPNIIKLYQVYEQQDLYVLIMELCEGGELFRKIARKEIRSKDSPKIMRQLVEAVAYIHSKNIVHRDIKPENILFDKQTKNIKLIDFGIAEKLDPSSYLTARIGTVYYIAPEVLLKRYNHKCDLWSAGVVLYMLLFSKPPFVGSNDYEIIDSVLNDEPEYTGRSWIELPRVCKELLVNLLQKDPAKRPIARQILKNSWLSEQPLPQKSKIMNSSAHNMAHFGFKNRLQAVVYTYCISQLLSKSQKQGLESIFKRCDTDYDGVISLAEFKTVMKEHVKDEKRLNNIMRLMDLDGSGTIQYTQFLVAVTNPRQQLTTEHYEKAFDYFDIDHSGGISYEEVAKFLEGSQAGEKIKQIFSEIDCNGDGNISREEFVELFLKATHSIKDIQHPNQTHTQPTPPTLPKTPLKKTSNNRPKTKLLIGSQ